MTNRAAPDEGPHAVPTAMVRIHSGPAADSGAAAARSAPGADVPAPGEDRTVIGRAVAVLDAVAAATEPLSLAALTAATSLPKPTARRIANELVRRGVLAAAPGGYRLGPRLDYYGSRALRDDRLAATAQPYLWDLSWRTGGEIAWCGTLLGGELTFRSPPVFGHRYREAVGAQGWPSMAMLGPSVVLTAGGRLQVALDDRQAGEITQRGCRPLTRHSAVAPRRLTANLAAARDAGFASEQEQALDGWCCAAAVVRGADERPVGIVGVTGRGGAAQRSIQRVLIAAAGGIARELRTGTSSDRPRPCCFLPESASAQ
ncbi:helix-turn-helix domain-containing protein [Nocardia aurantia]|uniref:IclR family transcriptional regulator n=1 Tax=Nocardia aurantia TaxID=2585199 RepID=A0A7K0DK13_9NOCA|nr:helix-turn-helix domain-containing protein [Nocardia aurantia]MQY25931.1 hypothetical protein [Nocardia aurantia]